MENWKDIPGFPGYKASDEGKIRSVERYINHIYTNGHNQRLVKGRLMKSHPDKDGYMRVRLSKDGHRIRKAIHRLIAISFIPNPDNLSTVDHMDENKLNNNLSNLQWLSAADNSRKSMSKQVRIHKEDVTLEFFSCTLASEYIKCGSASVGRVARGDSKTIRGWNVEFI